MMENPLVSVIVLTYNQCDTVGLALDSVLAQQCDFDFEVVVGDDASTDGTRAVCEDYVRRFQGRVRLMPKAPNKGLVRNYFECLEACRGRYIADCSGDDRWTSVQKLQRQVRMLERNPSCSAVATDWTESGGVIVRSADSPSLRQLLEGRNTLPVHLSTVLYRVDVVRAALAANRNVVWNPDYGCEDVPVLAALIAAGPVLRLPVVTLDYNSGDGTVSRSRNPEREIRHHLSTLQCKLDLARNYGVDVADIAPALRHKADYIVTLAFRSGRTEWRNEALAAVSSSGLRRSLRSLVLTEIMKRDALWGIAQKLWLMVRK